jgi:uncharacterized protein YcfJ
VVAARGQRPAGLLVHGLGGGLGLPAATAAGRVSGGVHGRGRLDRRGDGTFREREPVTGLLPGRRFERPGTITR